jgi:hypothetical protein
MSAIGSRAAESRETGGGVLGVPFLPVSELNSRNGGDNDGMSCGTVIDLGS